MYIGGKLRKLRGGHDEAAGGVPLGQRRAYPSRGGRRGSFGRDAACLLLRYPVELELAEPRLFLVGERGMPLLAIGE
jgi:hypothetical protein